MSFFSLQINKTIDNFSELSYNVMHGLVCVVLFFIKLNMKSDLEVYAIFKTMKIFYNFTIFAWF